MREILDQLPSQGRYVVLTTNRVRADDLQRAVMERIDTHTADRGTFLSAWKYENLEFLVRGLDPTIPVIIDPAAGERWGVREVVRAA